MSTMSDNRSIGANASVENILSGKLHEFLSEASVITVAISAAAVGVNTSILIGGESIMQDQEVSSSNRFPIMPDDIAAQGAGFESDRLIVSLRNTTGVAIIVQTTVMVEPA